MQIEVTREELQIILDALQDRPHREVFVLVEKVYRQGKAQEAAEAPAETAGETTGEEGWTVSSAIARPPMTAPIGKVGPGGVVQLTPEWAQYLSRLGALQEHGTESGTTAQRPTTDLYVGRRYFNTTLGQDQTWNGSSWV